MRNSASAASVQENRPRITGRQAKTRASVPLLLTWPASALGALIFLSGGNARSSARVDGRPVGTTTREGPHQRLSKITAAGTSPPLPGFIRGEGRPFRPRLVTQRANEERVPITHAPDCCRQNSASESAFLALLFLSTKSSAEAAAR